MMTSDTALNLLGRSEMGSIAQTQADWTRVFLLQDYNTRVVLFCVALLGIAAGVIGSFTLLRKRALLGDALAHASLPGIALAFIGSTLLGGSGKSLPLLLLGAAFSGLLGMALVLLVRRKTRLKEDAGLGISLSVFFGAGMALMGIIQQMEYGHAAGLEGFIYGKSASMNLTDAYLIGAVSLVTVLTVVAFLKELTLLCFDDSFAQSLGLRPLAIDILLMSLVVLVTLSGLQAVGLILIVALMVIPPASARFWTDSLSIQLWIAGGLGGLSGLIGCGLSAIYPRLPSGAMVVLTCAAFFLMSLLLGSKRGVVMRWLSQIGVDASNRQSQLLRDLYEQRLLRIESNSYTEEPLIELAPLLLGRSWTSQELNRLVDRCAKNGFVKRRPEGITLTERGLATAASLSREKQMWELYLLHYPEIAPGQFENEADRVSDKATRDVVAHLESLLPDYFARTSERASLSHSGEIS